MKGLWLVLLLSACAATTPNFDAHFGQSARAAVALQTRDPQAPAQAPIDGLDGPAAHHAVEQYYQSFEQAAQPTNVFNIGLGTGASGAR